MNGWIKATFGISGAGLFLILAGNLKELIAAIEAGWIFLTKLATDSPLGLTSFAMALALASLSISFMNKYIPLYPQFALRGLIIDLAALAIGISVVWVQTHDLSGLLLGLMAGLAARLVYRFFSTIRELIMKTVAPKIQEKQDA